MAAIFYRRYFQINFEVGKSYFIQIEPKFENENILC